MTSLTSLIERIEGATEGSRELDVAVVYAVHPDIGPYAPHCQGDEPIFYHAPYYKQECPNFTSSIDAALTLLPEGWWLTLDRYSLSDKEPDLFAWRVWLKRLVGDVDGDGPCRLAQFFATGSTAPLALLAAILRARQTEAR